MNADKCRWMSVGVVWLGFVLITSRCLAEEVTFSLDEAPLATLAATKSKQPNRFVTWGFQMSDRLFSLDHQYHKPYTFGGLGFNR